MNKNIVLASVITAVVVAVVVLAGASFVLPKQVERITEKQVLGATPTLDGVDNPYVSIGGLRQYWWHQSVAATGSAICVLKNPFKATSTLKSFTLKVKTSAQATALYWALSTSSNGYSTTSIVAFINGARIEPNLKNAEFVYDPTATSTIGDLTVWGAMSSKRTNGVSSSSQPIIGADEYLIARVASTSYGVFNAPIFDGSCSGILEAIQ